DRAEVLKEGFFPVTPHSYARTVDSARSGSIDFPLLVCKQLMSGGIRTTREHPIADRGNFSLPDNIDVIRFAARILTAKLSAIIRAAFTRTEWNVGVIDGPHVNPF